MSGEHNYWTSLDCSFQTDFMSGSEQTFFFALVESLHRNDFNIHNLQIHLQGSFNGIHRIENCCEPVKSNCSAERTKERSSPWRAHWSRQIDAHREMLFWRMLFGGYSRISAGMIYNINSLRFHSPSFGYESWLMIFWMSARKKASLW